MAVWYVRLHSQIVRSGEKTQIARQIFS